MRVLRKKTRWLPAGGLVAGLLIPRPAAAAGREDFLVLPTDARSAALAGVVAAEEAPGALFANPAALAQAPRTTLAFSRVPELNGAFRQQWAVAQNMGAPGTLALGGTSHSFGAVPLADAEGGDLGQAAPRDDQFIVGYARALRGVPLLSGGAVGVTGSVLRSRLIGTARSVSLGAGWLSRPLGRWVWGASLAHVGRALTDGDGSTPLPATLRAGAAWAPRERWSLGADAVSRRGEPVVPALGMEYLRPARRVSLAFRAGYDGDRGRRQILDGVRLGLGVAWSSFRIDYFYRPGGEDLSSQGLTLRLAWSGRGAVLPPSLQALIDRGNRLVESARYPEAILLFDEALNERPDCAPAREGLERAYRRMTGP